ncbi:MAG: aminopeptidase [Actinobacteria bacterium]|nr:aminopeptidase [Actinomycetota bacterium]
MTSAPAESDSLLAPDELARYADAIVRSCLYLEEGDALFVQGTLGHRELAVALAEAGYRAGARLVDVHYSDPRLQAARVRQARDEFLGPVSAWAERRLRTQLQASSAVVTIFGESDPGVLDGLPPERVAEDSLRPLGKVRWFVRAVEAGRWRWAGVAWPTAFWAGQVYPELGSLEAQRHLARDLLHFCRLGPGDPPDASGWREHAAAVARRAETLTGLELERLELRGDGTSLSFRLSPETLWLGGQGPNADGRLVAPNFPTEEVFTSPDARGTEGTFRCSRPLAFRGRTIEGLGGEFRRGRLVRLEAASADDRDFLAAFLDADRRGRWLGEVALVDSTSRIGRAGRTYLNTLIDENAVAHIAFGSGFGQTRVPSPGMRGARGVNQGTMHLDVMIGTEELEATGFTADGARVPLIAGGLWQI